MLQCVPAVLDPAAQATGHHAAAGTSALISQQEEQRPQRHQPIQADVRGVVFHLHDFLLNTIQTMVQIRVSKTS